MEIASNAANVLGITEVAHQANLGKSLPFICCWATGCLSFHFIDFLVLTFNRGINMGTLFLYST